MKIGIMGAGAFGTALAISLSDRPVVLWARDPADMNLTRKSPRLPAAEIPKAVSITGEIGDIAACDIVLLAVPAQKLRAVLAQFRDQLDGKMLVACCKGIDLETLTGPVTGIRDTLPNTTAAILTGPAFATDIARGLPTALTLACGDEAAGKLLQEYLSTQALRIYRTTDTIGAELGGALKNVIAIACGVTIGAGLGDSARAALMTRGFAEMQRVAEGLGADPQTLIGLSGLGDLALTCTSDLSRNYRHGHNIGAGIVVDTTMTVEGAATSQAMVRLAHDRGLDLPICAVVAALTTGKIDTAMALKLLLSRPLREE